MLESLTKDEEKILEEVRQEWYNLALKSNIEVSEKEIIADLNWLYKHYGHNAPKKVYICDSMKAMKETINKIAYGGKSNENPKQYAGLCYETWLPFYDFLNRIGKLDIEKYNRYVRMIKKGVWSIVFFDEACFITKLPLKIRQDDRGRLHSVTSAAIEWRDGHGNYFIRGVGFPKDLWTKVTKRTLKAKDLISIENIEQRYIALELYGTDKLIDDLGARLVDKSKRGNELFEIDGLIPNRKVKLMRYSCPSTARVYTSFVPDNITKADAGMAWKLSMTEDQYANLKIEA